MAVDYGNQQIVRIGQRFAPQAIQNYAPVPVYYQAQYADTPSYYYRYDDNLGYLYRINRYDNAVSGLIPLFGGYGIGDPWPVNYASSYVPLGYRDYYYDTPDYYYRYDGSGIYQIDARTQLITALVALLSGNGLGLGVGSLMPASYGVYNVPMAYRSSYYDTPDRWYRYGDGYIYQVDPGTRRIAARYPIYGDQYDVGSPWPAAYPAYNVPLAYQSVYADTPQWQYRYANGAIYQVDPQTQVIQALVALLSGQRFNVGQPMPVAYSTYNVPLAYRDRYYDTSNDYYRYADGYIYQVDPGTGLIQQAIPAYA
ncbi:hypothetical protein ABDK56_02330 [Sphingomonas sp. ASV193]|uniref:hypothetical protein n=1 Tax=Sphingomonas sp. ASV193 TaxID=3144405 RepID=UPI0032E91486